MSTVSVLIPNYPRQTSRENWFKLAIGVDLSKKGLSAVDGQFLERGEIAELEVGSYVIEKEYISARRSDINIWKVLEVADPDPEATMKADHLLLVAFWNYEEKDEAVKYLSGKLDKATHEPIAQDPQKSLDSALSSANLVALAPMQRLNLRGKKSFVNEVITLEDKQFYVLYCEKSYFVSDYQAADTYEPRGWQTIAHGAYVENSEARKIELKRERIIREAQLQSALAADDFRNGEKPEYKAAMDALRDLREIESIS